MKTLTYLVKSVYLFKRLKVKLFNYIGGKLIDFSYPITKILDINNKFHIILFELIYNGGVDLVDKATKIEDELDQEIENNLFI